MVALSAAQQANHELTRTITKHLDILLCVAAPSRVCPNQNDDRPETPLSLLRFDRQQNYFGLHAKADWNDARANPCGYEQMVIVFEIVSPDVAIV